jgi:hypothetical protein
VAQLAMALAALLLWLFFSPHRHAEQGASLDRKREFPSPSCNHFYQCTIYNRHFPIAKVGSFFGFKFLSSLLIILFHNAANCTTSLIGFKIFTFVWLTASLGIGKICTRAWGRP